MTNERGGSQVERGVRGATFNEGMRSTPTPAGTPEKTK